MFAQMMPCAASRPAQHRQPRHPHSIPSPPGTKPRPRRDYGGCQGSTTRQRRIPRRPSMTFPRPCLYALLAACLLLPGCVANQYAIKINAVTNGDIQTGIGDVYYIMAVKGQEDDLVFLELKRNLESALPEAGLKVTRSLPHATAVLFAGYKSRTVARQTTVSEPVYGVTRVETRGTGEYINTLTGKTGRTSVSTPTYGVTGYKNTQKEVAQNKIVLLLAADSLKTKKKMWETIVTYTGDSFDNRKMLGVMVTGAKEYLAQTTPGDTWLEVSESDDGILSIKEKQ